MKTALKLGLALFGFLLISYVYFGMDILGYQHRIGGSIGDSYIYVWSLAWWHYALTHHLNPFLTDFVWSPKGYNLAGATTMPGIFLLTAPLQSWFSVETAYNVAYIFAPGLAGWTMFLLCYGWLKQMLPALFAGFLFGFSGYMITQMYGHLNLTFGVFIIPLLVLLFSEYYQEKISRRFFIVGSVIGLVFLFLISLEVFLTFTVCASIAYLIALLIFKNFRPQLLKTAYYIVIAYLLTGFIVSPYLYYFFIGHNVNLALPITICSNDFLSFFIPQPSFWLSNPWSVKIASYTAVNASERNAYLGIPLLLIIFLFSRQKGDRKFGRFLIVIALIFAVISLGPILHVAGMDVIGMYPNEFLFQLPFIKDSLPCRYMLYANFVIGLIVAIWLASASKWWWGKYILVSLAILFLMPTFNSEIYSRYALINDVSMPPFFSKNVYQKFLSKGETVMILPEYGIGAASIYYQVKSDFYFKLASGYIGIPPNMNNLVEYHMIINSTQRIYGSQVRRFLKNNHIGHLIVLDAAFNDWEKVLAQMRIVPVHVQGVRIYKIN